MDGINLADTLWAADATTGSAIQARITARRAAHAAELAARWTAKKSIAAAPPPAPVASSKPTVKLSGWCTVCEEEHPAPQVACSYKTCKRMYHRACLPELRRFTATPGAWVCPPCRRIHKLGPVLLLGTDLEVEGMQDMLSVPAEQPEGAVSSLAGVSKSHDDICSACDRDGDLVLCDGPTCTRAYHMACAPDLAAAGALPEGTWLCPACTAPPSDSPSAAAVAPVEAVPPPSSSSDAAPAEAFFAFDGVLEDMVACEEPAVHACIDTLLRLAMDKLESQRQHLVALKPGRGLDVGDAPVSRSSSSSSSSALPDTAWQRLVATVRTAAELHALQQLPEYEHIKRCLWLADKPRSSRNKGIGRDEVVEEDVCVCAERGHDCDDRCMNKLLLTECTKSNCGYGTDKHENCHNRNFNRRNDWPVYTLPTPEYVGELIDDVECERRLRAFKEAGQVHFHMLEISRDLVIDAGSKGNYSRFINHSCAPNCSAEKWTVGNETRVGIFAKNDIPPGTELTYDYAFVTFSEQRWDCQCGEATCRGFLGVNKREALTAAALNAAGVFQDLRFTGNVEPGAEPPEGNGAVAGPRGHRGKHLDPHDPTLFHDESTPPASTPLHVLGQLREAMLTDQEAAWVREQRVFVVGSRPAAPNLLDDGQGSTPSRSRGGRNGSRKRGAAASVEASSSSSAAAFKPWAQWKSTWSTPAAPGVAATSDATKPRSKLDAEIARVLAEAVAASKGTPRRRGALFARLGSLARISLAAGELIQTTALERAHAPSVSAASANATPPSTDAAVAQLVGQAAWRPAVVAAASAHMQMQQGATVDGVRAVQAALAATPMPLRRDDAVDTPPPAAVTVDVNTGTAAASRSAVQLTPWADMELLQMLQTMFLNSGIMTYSIDDDVMGDAAEHDGVRDAHDTVCAKCYGSGDLVCCDGCPRAYHLSCVSLYQVPADRWLCPACKSSARSSRRAAQQSAAPGGSTVRHPGSIPARDAEAMLMLLAAAPAPRVLLEPLPPAVAALKPVAVHTTEGRSRAKASPNAKAAPVRAGSKRSRSRGAPASEEVADSEATAQAVDGNDGADSPRKRGREGDAQVV